MCIFVDYVIQTFLCSMFSLEVSNSLSLAFRVISILVVFDIWKCASLTGGAKVQVTGHRLQVAGHSSQVTGHNKNTCEFAVSS